MLVCLAQAAAAPKPNLLLVIADDATFSELSLFGGTNLKTPNVDRRAQKDPGAELDTGQKVGENQMHMSSKERWPRDLTTKP